MMAMRNPAHPGEILREDAPAIWASVWPRRHPGRSCRGPLDARSVREFLLVGVSVGSTLGP